MDIRIAGNPDYFYIPLYLISTFLGSRLIFRYLAKRRILKPLVFLLFINLNLVVNILLYPSDYDITYAYMFLLLGVFVFDIFYLFTRLIIFLRKIHHRHNTQIAQPPTITKTENKTNYLDKILFWFHILLLLLAIYLLVSGKSIGWPFAIFGWFYVYIPLKLYDKLRVNPPPPSIAIYKEKGKFVLILKEDWAKYYDFFLMLGRFLKQMFYTVILPLTGIFPFSLIGKNKLGHRSHTQELKMMNTIEKLAYINKINLRVVEVEMQSVFTNYKCIVKTKRKTPWQEKFTADLIEETKTPSIYLRQNSKLTDAIDVLVPRVDN